MNVQKVRAARPGEMCGCGKPAKAALIRKLGDVPTCKSPEEYRQELERSAQMARGGILHSSGQSGSR